ncbi:MAG TPA: SpoIID/LytB domain-containing protein, partial [Pyrinomonadaceae bacterium]
PGRAFKQALSPGSTIKVFTALTAMQSNLINEKSRLLCHEHYASADFEINCSHPKIAAPFDPAQAIAYSCNYYFGKLGERIDAASFNSLLAAFGFGARTGLNHEGEATGSLPRVVGWQARDAIGEGRELRVTPIQLLMAYAALVNGGHLYTPQLAAAHEFKQKERAALSIAPAHRALLIEGMRGAVTYGTALRSGLNNLPLYIFGKTGTATAGDGPQTQGWFVGFASEQSSGATQSVSPDSAKLAVLVFLSEGHGAQCAEAARSIFAAFARPPDEGRAVKPANDTETRETETRAGEIETRAQDESSQDESLPVVVPAPSSSSETQVSVHLVGEDRTVSVSFEDYVLGVLAVEGAIEEEPEALKALAVAVRTYALRNLKRHAADGYDFCSTTHCQRYTFIAEGEKQRVRETLRRAFDETAGEVLLDETGHVADAYFHAACGGMTANVATLWGNAGPKHLRGVRDEYCASMPHHDWTDVIPAARLARALASDARTDVGPRLDNLILSRRDATGRAELITLEGARRRTVRGWDFKIIVGRALGWNVLKSSRFVVSRAGENFIFRGGGFGHGVGLCQEGAHVMARRGINYRRILSHYFPSTSVGRKTPEAETIQATAPDESAPRQPAAESNESRAGFSILASLETWKADVLTLNIASRAANLHSIEPHAVKPQSIELQSIEPHAVKSHGIELQRALPASLVESSYVPLPRSSDSEHRRSSLAGEHFRVSYPAGVEQREAENILRALEAARVELLSRVNTVAPGFGGPQTLDVIVHATTGDFVVATGQPSWAAAATKGRRIELQPLAVLRRRGVLWTTLRHEYAHAMIDALSRGGAPRWLAEGLAIWFAGEGRMLARFATKDALPVDELERKLARPASAADMRSLYAKAYSETLTLVRAEGETGIWRRVARKE